MEEKSRNIVELAENSGLDLDSISSRLSVVEADDIEPDPDYSILQEEKVSSTPPTVIRGEFNKR